MMPTPHGFRSYREREPGVWYLACLCGWESNDISSDDGYDEEEAVFNAHRKAAK